jgi:hypothetical protein
MRVPRRAVLHYVDIADQKLDDSKRDAAALARHLSWRQRCPSASFSPAAAHRKLNA